MIDSTGKRVMNMWIILAFASALFAGITAILAKVGVKKTDSMLATLGIRIRQRRLELGMAQGGAGRRSMKQGFRQPGPDGIDGQSGEDGSGI